VSPRLPPLLYPLQFDQTPLPDPLLELILQQINADVLDQSSPAHRTSPAAPFTHVRTQSTSPSPPIGLPRRTAPRSLLPRRPGPPEPRRRSTSGLISGELAGNLAT
jgi:hypothetical protein